MSDPLQTLEAMLQGSAAVPQTFPPNSRYYSLPTLTQTLPDGRTVTYIVRRFVPQPDQFSPLKLHSVAQGDRLDILASKYFNDAQQYWRICDANNAVRPNEILETIGNRIRITLPQGVPGTPQGV
jgi:hypothetical protein